MAKKKQANDQEITVEDKLTALYELQTVLSEIDKIKTLRGELPLEVQDLEDEIVGLETRLNHYTEDVKDIDRDTTTEKHKIEEAKAFIERLQGQLNEVRNNREFDSISKEIEFQGLEVEHSEKKIREANEERELRVKDIDQLKEILDGRRGDLEHKKGELDEIISETRQEEEKFRERAKGLESKIEPRLLTAFKRIRKGARNGLAVVYIQRDACGGCFNKIPPQKQLDIRLRKKIIVCEYCGRIMIDPELAGVEE